MSVLPVDSRLRQCNVKLNAARNVTAWKSGWVKSFWSRFTRASGVGCSLCVHLIDLILFKRWHRLMSLPFLRLVHESTLLFYDRVRLNANKIYDLSRSRNLLEGNLTVTHTQITQTMLRALDTDR